MSIRQNKQIFAQKMHTVGDPQRLQIMCLLSAHTSMCVSDVAASLSVSVANASHHVRALEHVGLLTCTRSGKTKCYSISNDEFSKELKRFICKLKMI